MINLYHSYAYYVKCVDYANAAHYAYYAHQVDYTGNAAGQNRQCHASSIRCWINVGPNLELHPTQLLPQTHHYYWPKSALLLASHQSLTPSTWSITRTLLAASEMAADSRLDAISAETSVEENNLQKKSCDRFVPDAFCNFSEIIISLLTSNIPNWLILPAT